ncbi:MAG: bifunctional biotin--[acetyl-CoA-carboxylase] ligase/biotin operon repressor BirA [Gammaproteobacteria bacterium]|nr:bifunctional biotin--[acetyl-CoA-carboxylase] ligase/biotin operon repressor BirA [Gammaproteobacteria bacterium]
MNSNLKKLLKLLSDGEFHSGSALGKELQLTRSAIWKLIKQVKNLDIEVVAKTNQGYKIAQKIEFLNKTKIAHYLPNKYRKYLSELAIFDELPSTNSYLTESVKTNIKPQICFAEMQTSGKGRLGRKWISPFARNIYLSVLWQFDKKIEELSGLSIAVAVAVAKALELYGIKHDIGLKWPNDILWQKRKLAGILIEISGETHHLYNAVIGIGLNIAMPKDAAKKIDQPWADIAEITQAVPERNKLVGVLLDQLFTTLDIYQQQGITPFLAPWRKLDVSLNKKITVITPMQKKIVGIGKGIDTSGQLVIEDQSNGKLFKFVSGEVSLR